MKIFLLGMISGILIVLIAVSSYFAFGFAPVSTAASPMPFEHFLAKSAINARLGREMPRNVLIPVNESNSLLSG